ncbi:ABC transporter substrate-binding protein [Vallitalea okinawensis]|uniref:ABC transporter substrate-binding protein n=1 Tax=Vallitalea okinawensis TaxID=2078660 RepID=UPI000CFD9770|nr:extracellular solute-binding protein [Vallitalea okinawensis]
MNLKRVIALLLSLTLALSFIGCSNTKETSETKEEAPVTDKADTEQNTETSDEKEEVVLKIYTQYSDDDTKVPYDYAVAELAKEYPHVKLELDVQAQDDGQKLQTYAATGNLPDIFGASLSQINAFKENNNILVLDDYLESTGFINHIDEANYNLLYNVDGHAYTFPVAGNELVLWYYNKAIFEEYGVKVPETYDELLEAVKVFNENDIIPLSIFAKEKWIDVALYDTLVTSMEPEGITRLDQGKGSVTEEAYVEAAKKLQELVSAGLLAKGATNMNYDQARSLFYEGKAAMFLNGQWEIEDSTNALGDDVDWMWYPVSSSVSHAMSGGGSANGFAVSPYSEHQDLAVEVASFMALKYAEAKFIHRSNPILATTIDPSWVPAKEFPPMMDKLVTHFDTITSYTAFDWGLSNPSFKVAIEDQSQFILTPGYTADEFIDELDKEMQRIFGE